MKTEQTPWTQSLSSLAPSPCLISSLLPDTEDSLGVLSGCPLWVSPAQGLGATPWLLESGIEGIDLKPAVEAETGKDTLCRWGWLWGWGSVTAFVGIKLQGSL